MKHDDAEDGEHSGLERLSSELVSHIGHFLLHGRTDLSGYQVVGTYALPWEERPEHNEVMATYGHGICDEALPVPLADGSALRLQAPALVAQQPAPQFVCNLQSWSRTCVCLDSA